MWQAQLSAHRPPDAKPLLDLHDAVCDQLLFDQGPAPANHAPGGPPDESALLGKGHSSFGVLPHALGFAAVLMKCGCKLPGEPQTVSMRQLLRQCAGFVDPGEGLLWIP